MDNLSELFSRLGRIAFNATTAFMALTLSLEYFKRRKNHVRRGRRYDI